MSIWERVCVLKDFSRKIRSQGWFFFETAFMELAPLENEGGQSFGGKTVEISDGKARPFNERNSLSHK